MSHNQTFRPFNSHGEMGEQTTINWKREIAKKIMNSHDFQIHHS